MISAAQLRAARALLGIDQRELADLAGLSVPTIQRMEASEQEQALAAARFDGAFDESVIEQAQLVGGRSAEGHFNPAAACALQELA